MYVQRNGKGYFVTSEDEIEDIMKKEEKKNKIVKSIPKKKESCTIEEFYIARDCYGLTIYKHLPKRFHDKNNDNDYWSGQNELMISLPQTAFPNLKWEDEPKKIKIIIEEA